MNENFTEEKDFYQLCRDYDTNVNDKKPDDIDCLKDHEMSDCRQNLLNCESISDCHNSCKYCYKEDVLDVVIMRNISIILHACHSECLNFMNLVSQTFLLPKSLTNNLCIPNMDNSTQDDPYKI